MSIGLADGPIDMNDEKSREGSGPKPTFKSFIKFLGSVKSKTDCPTCEHIGWTVESVWDEDDGDLMASVTAIPFAEIPATADLVLSEIERRGLPTISLSCVNCGFIRQHSFATFRKWLNKQHELGDTSQEGQDGK